MNLYALAKLFPVAFQEGREDCLDGKRNNPYPLTLRVGPWHAYEAGWSSALTEEDARKAG